MEIGEILIFALLVIVIVWVCLIAAGCLIKARSMDSNWETFPQRRRWFLRVQSVCLALFLIGILNFAVFSAVGLAIGGSALIGKTENGRYFVANHGRFTEVSQATWVFSYYHGKSTSATHSLGILAMLVWMWSSRLSGEKILCLSEAKSTMRSQEAGSGSV